MTINQENPKKSTKKKKTLPLDLINEFAKFARYRSIKMTVLLYTNKWTKRKGNLKDPIIYHITKIDNMLGGKSDKRWAKHPENKTALGREEKTLANGGMHGFCGWGGSTLPEVASPHVNVRFQCHLHRNLSRFTADIDELIVKGILKYEHLEKSTHTHTHTHTHSLKKEKNQVRRIELN